jgi:dTDP-glucose pyrophosphorylase
VEDEALARLLVSEDASIRDAMQAIDRGAVEVALMVDGRGRLVGTVTDGDIRRALLAGATLDSAVVPHVQRSPKTASPTDGRAEILDLMRARSITQIPVVDEGNRLIGLHVMRELLGAHRRPNAAVIMAGGRGTRLGSLTESVPKPMLKVAGRPILERLVLHLTGSGIGRIFLSVNYLAHVIEEHFGDGDAFGCEIRYLREDPATPLGTAGSLRLLEEHPDALAAPLLVMNGDLVTDFLVADLLTSHERAGAKVTIAVSDYEQRIPFGVAEIDDGRLVRLNEKPVASWLVNAGIYVLDPTLVGRVSGEREHHVTALIEDCLARGELVNVWHAQADWQDVGRPAELSRARGQM